MCPVRTTAAEHQPVMPKGAEAGLALPVVSCVSWTGGWKTLSWFSLCYRHLMLMVAEDLVFGPSALSDQFQVLANAT